MCAAVSAEARSITDVQRRVENGKMFLDVTFEAGSDGDNHALYIAYDTEDKGADISDWAELQRGCNISVTDTSAEIPVSPLLTEKGYTFCRVFLTTSAAPYDTQIEYLRQSGKQYIDTGIRPDATSVAVMDTKFDSNNPRQQRFFGISSGDDATAVFSFDCYINGSGKFASACKDGKGDWKEAAAFTANRVRISLSAKDKHRIVITNLETGSQIVDATRKTTCSKTSIANLLVFALHTVKNSVASIPEDKIAQGARLYSFSVTTNSVIACDYKPCKLGDRVGVYDTVTGKIIYSASGTHFDAADSGSPVACSLLADETPLAAAPSATELFFDYTWHVTAENWGDANVWTLDGENATWTDGNNAIFRTANATATLAADVSANSIAFRADATVAGTGELTVKSVSVDSGVSAAISAPISSAFEKTGAGVLTLTQDRTTATIVKEGTLKMDGATIADLTLGTDGGAPVTFDYGGQELVKNTRDYLVTGSTVTLTNGTFSTASGDDLNIRDDTFTMPSVLTIAKDAVVRQGAIGKSVYIVNVNGTATINVIGGTLGNTDGCDLAYLQHKSPDGGLNLNVSEGGLVYFPCQVYALCRGDIAATSPSLYMTFANSAFSVGTKFQFGSSWSKDSYVPTAPTGVFAATNSVVSVGDGFIVGRNNRDSKTAGSLTVDFENCVVTAKMFAVYYDRPLNNARFNSTRFVFGAESGSFAASDDAANWITVGDDGLTLDTQAYSATLNANFGGSGAVTKVGAGTLTLARDQTSTAAFNVGEGTLALNAGLTVNRPIAVANGATFTVNATSQATVNTLTLVADSTLNIASYTEGVTPLAVTTSVTLPESGTLNLTMDGGAFGEGVYAIYSATGVTAADGDKFSFDLAIADLIPTWSVEDGALVLTVRATAQTWNGAAGERVSWADGWTGGAWVETHDAIFNTAGAIASVDADVSANAVKFNESVTVNGSATLTPHVVFVAEGKEATINAPTAAALEKTGLGALTLAQNRADATIVTEGTLKMDGATVAGLTLGTYDGAPVAFDYGGQELVKNPQDYLVTGSTVTLTNGVFATVANYDLNLRDDSSGQVFPSVLTIAKDATLSETTAGKAVYICKGGDGTSTINIAGGALEKPSGTGNAYIQHKSVSGRVNINVTDGGRMSFPDVVYALCRGDISVTTPSLYMTFCDSTFNVGGTFNFGSSYTSDKYVPTNPTGVFAATNSVISIGGAFNIGRNKQDEKTDGSLTADFENCTVTAKTFAVYYDRSLNNARFNNTRFVFNADSGSIAASDSEANWITVGADGLTIDTQTYAASLNANLGGFGAVTKVGAGTLTVASNQTSTAAFNVSEGALAVNGGVSVSRPIAVASGATLTVKATDTANVANLSLADGSTLNITSYNSITPFTVGSLTLPESGTVNLTLNGGAFTRGVYAIYSKSGVTAADGAKFTPSTGDLDFSWSVSGDKLVLTVGELPGNYWTGLGGDGRMSTAANWLNGVPAAGADIDLSFISSSTTIIADTGRAFGAVTMGDGVITFADSLAATSISDTSKVAVDADSTVTLEGDLVIDTTSGNKYIVNSVADGGKFKVTGKIRAIGTNNLWPSYVKTCNGAIEASGLVSAVSGSDLWSFRLSNSGGHIGKWIIGKDGFVCDGAAGFWVHNNSNDRTEIQAAADFTIQDAWIGLSTKATTFTIQTTSPDGIARTITAKTGFAAHADGACNLDVRGSGTFLCDYTVKVFSSGGPKAFSGAITVKDTATFAVNSEKYPTTGAISVNSEATFKLAQSGVVTLSGNLSFADGAALGFNFTNRKVGPLLALASGKSLSFVGEGEKNIAIKVSGDVWPVGGEHVLTTCGGFDAEGVTVSLASGAPKWAKSVYVNNDGNIVLDVKPRATMVIVR